MGQALDWVCSGSIVNVRIDVHLQPEATSQSTERQSSHSADILTSRWYWSEISWPTCEKRVLCGQILLMKIVFSVHSVVLENLFCKFHLLIILLFYIIMDIKPDQHIVQNFNPFNYSTCICFEENSASKIPKSWVHRKDTFVC